MYTYIIAYEELGFREEFETDAKNILQAIGNFLELETVSIDQIVSITC